jgi:hypothetical protein
MPDHAPFCKVMQNPGWARLLSDGGSCTELHRNARIDKTNCHQNCHQSCTTLLIQRGPQGGPEDPRVEYFGERVSTANWNFILVRMRGLCRAQDANTFSRDSLNSIDRTRPPSRQLSDYRATFAAEFPSSGWPTIHESDVIWNCEGYGDYANNES